MSEVKQAAERLRRIREGGSLEESYPQLNFNQFHEAVDADFETVLTAYFQEHQPDDDEPITENFLQSMFGDEESAGLTISIAGVGLIELDFATGEKLRIKDSCFQTRGQVRLLVRALGGTT